MRNVTIAAAIAATVAVGAAGAQAATVTPAVVGYSSQYGGYEAVYAADAFAVTDWASLSQGAGSFIDFDLGAFYTLSSADVTDRVTSGGGNGAYVYGTTDFTNQFSLTFFDSSFTLPGATYAFSKATPVNPNTTAAFQYNANLSGATGRYVRYTVLATDGGQANDNPGLSNISFNAVPEPATWALMITGFGATGLMLRRRRTLATAATA